MSQITVIDAAGVSQTVAKITNTGQATSAESMPVVISSDQSSIPVIASNITTKFRDSFDSYTPGVNWAETKDSGDLLVLDGNSASCGYLVLSKSPLTSGTLTSIETLLPLGMPIEVSAGLSMSQRTLGQDFAIEIVDTEPPLSAIPDVAISSISQTTTTLTVTTATAHNLTPGRRVSISGVNDSRVNYPSLVVASIPTPTQFTATAGPNGTIPSLTIGPFTTGVVSVRHPLGLSLNGTSMIFENVTVGNASIYVSTGSLDALPSGTIAGNHSVSVGTTASIQAINAAYTYAFQPSTEYRACLQADRLQWYDSTVDSVAGFSARATRTQSVPSPSLGYKVRIRGVNNKGFSVVTAQIVSAVKTGTTTATITTATAHGLTVADLVTVYGIRDQAASSFPNLTTATAVASIVDATTFTIVIGTASTVTSYGGFVGRVNGGNLQSALGVNAIVAQSAVLASGILTITGSGTWTGLLVGDYVNVVGLRNSTNGATLAVDGAWKIRQVSTTVLELQALPGTSVPADFGSTNCGGAIVKRTDLRIGFVRVFDFERERVELLSRPGNDISASAPVQVTNSPAVTIGSGTVTTVTTLTGGNAAEDAATTASPLIIGGVVRTATGPTTLVAGDAARATITSGAQLVNKPYGLPETDWQFTGALTSTTAAAAKTAGAAGIRNYVTDLSYQNTSATATTVLLLDGATTIAQFNAPASMALPAVVTFPTPKRGTAATAMNVNCGTAAANVLINVGGYQAP